MYNLIYYKDNFDMLKAPLDYITSPKYIKQMKGNFDGFKYNKKTKFI